MSALEESGIAGYMMHDGELHLAVIWWPHKRDAPPLVRIAGQTETLDEWRSRGWIWFDAPHPAEQTLLPVDDVVASSLYPMGPATNAEQLKMTGPGGLPLYSAPVRD